MHGEHDDDRRFTETSDAVRSKSLDPADSQWTEAQIAAWLIGCIAAHDAGTLPSTISAQITEIVPQWLSDDTRFHYGLFMDWSLQRLAAFVGSKLQAYDAGTLPPEEFARMNRTMPDWLTDAARVFCALTPAGW